MAEYVDNKGFAEVLYKIKNYVDNLAGNGTTAYTNNVTAVANEYLDSAGAEAALQKIKDYIDSLVPASVFEDSTSYKYESISGAGKLLNISANVYMACYLVYNVYPSSNTITTFNLKEYTGSDSTYTGKYFNPAATESTLSSTIAEGYYLSADNTGVSTSTGAINQMIFDYWVNGAWQGQISFVNVQGVSSATSSSSLTVGTLNVVNSSGIYRGSNVSVAGTTLLTNIIIAPTDYGLVQVS